MCIHRERKEARNRDRKKTNSTPNAEKNKSPNRKDVDKSHFHTKKKAQKRKKSRRKKRDNTLIEHRIHSPEILTKTHGHMDNGRKRNTEETCVQ